jgi:hypothetical protein
MDEQRPQNALLDVRRETEETPREPMTENDQPTFTAPCPGCNDRFALVIPTHYLDTGDDDTIQCQGSGEIP